MDRIEIKGLRIFAHHGVFREEKENGQPFVLDVTLFVDLSVACRTDKVGDTVHYAEACGVIRAAMVDYTYDLIERAAQGVADALLNTYTLVQAVDVCLSKPRAPIAADFDTVRVCIHRERANG